MCIRDRSQHIFKGDNNHQGKQQEQPRRIHPVFNLWIDRLTSDGLNDQKDNSAAIQRWERQKIEDTDTDRNKRRNVDKAAPSDCRRLTNNLTYAHGTGKLGDPDMPGNQITNGDPCVCLLYTSRCV